MFQRNIAFILSEVQDEEPVLGAKFVRMFQKDPFRPLLSLLQRQGLLNKRFIFRLSFYLVLCLLSFASLVI